MMEETQLLIEYRKGLALEKEARGLWTGSSGNIHSTDLNLKLERQIEEFVL